MLLVWLLLAASFFALIYLAALTEDELKKVRHEHELLRKEVAALYEKFRVLSVERDKYKFQTDQHYERCYKGKGKFG